MSTAQRRSRPGGRPGGTTAHRELARLAGAVTALEWSPRGEQLAAGGPDGVVMVGASGGGRRAEPVRTHEVGRVRAVTWSGGGTWLAAVGDQEVTMIDSGGEVLAAMGTRAWGPVVAWAPDRPALAVGSGQDLAVVDPSGRLVLEHPWLGAGVNDLVWVGAGCLAVAMRGGLMLVAVGDRAVPGSGGPGGHTEAPGWIDIAGLVTTLAAAPGGGRVAAGNIDGSVRVVCTITNEAVEMTDYDSTVDLLAWQADGRRLAVASADEATVWELDGIEVVSGEPVLLGNEPCQPTTVTFHPTDSLVAVGDTAGSVALWSIPSEGDAVEVATLAAGAEVTATAWHPGGTTLAVGTAAGRVLAWAAG